MKKRKKTTKTKYRARKQKKYLIVDGYNLINADEDLKKLGNESLEDAREKLVDIMSEYSEYTGFESVLVFDAYRVKGPSEVIENISGTQVVFTKESQTADSYIEKFISGLSRFDYVCVVTDDNAEQQIALGKGAVRISTREFKQDLNKAFARIEEKTRARSKDISNRVETYLSDEVLDKLEKIRRSKI